MFREGRIILLGRHLFVGRLTQRMEEGRGAHAAAAGGCCSSQNCRATSEAEVRPRVFAGDEESHRPRSAR